MEGRVQEGVEGEPLLLDPHARGGKLGEEVVAGGGGIVGGDEALEARAFVGGHRLAERGEAAVGGGVHEPRLDGDARTARQAAQDEDAGAIEVGGETDRRAPGAQAEERDGRPARLAAGQDHELAAEVGPLDVVEEGRLVLDHGDDVGVERDERRVAELLERQRRDVAERRVAADVIEDLAALGVDERAGAVDGDGGVVAQEAEGVEGGALDGGPRARLAGERVAGDRRDVGERGLGEAAGALAAGRERLAVAEDARREVGDAQRRVERERGLERARDVGDDRDGGVGAALAREVPGLAAASGGERSLAGQEGGGRGVSRRRKRGERGLERARQTVLLGAPVAALAAEGREEDREGVGARALECGEVDPDLARAGRDDGARREDLGERGDGLRGRGDRGARRRRGARVEEVEELGDGLAGGGDAREDLADREGGGERIGRHDDLAYLHALIAGDGEAALAAGAAPALRRGLPGGTASVLVAERAPQYLTVLYALLVRRRGHELEPFHDDLWHLVAEPLGQLGPYDPAAFSQDVEQLVAWGALVRRTEAQRLRSYRDNRRERYRYRLSDDAVAFLEWLEGRLSAQLAGRAGDARDRLADVVGHVREVTRVLERWHRGEVRDGDAGRRALHLVDAIGDAIDDAAAELLGLHGAMAAFAGQMYDVATLRDVLGALERYVHVYLTGLDALRGEIEQGLGKLAAPRLGRALDECRAAIEVDLAARSRLARGGMPPPPRPRLAAHAAFFAAGGPLERACLRVQAAARDVLHKMWRHLSELERRNARLADLRAAVETIAARPAADDPRLGALGTAVFASAHVRLDRRAPASGARAAPPMSRRHARAATPAVRAPLARKQGSAAAARALRAARLDELRRWVAAEVLGDEPRVRLAARGLAGADAPRRWMDVVRARHLGAGGAARALGVSLTEVDGRAVVGDDRAGLDAPDCWIERKEQEE